MKPYTDRKFAIFALIFSTYVLLGSSLFASTDAEQAEENKAVLGAADFTCVAQPAETSRYINLLLLRYGEINLWSYPHKSGGSILFFLNAETGTWTLLLTNEDGSVACPVLDGIAQPT